MYYFHLSLCHIHPDISTMHVSTGIIMVLPCARCDHIKDRFILHPLFFPRFALEFSRCSISFFSMIYLSPLFSSASCIIATKFHVLHIMFLVTTDVHNQYHEFISYVFMPICMYVLLSFFSALRAITTFHLYNSELYYVQCAIKASI